MFSGYSIFFYIFFYFKIIVTILLIINIDLFVSIFNNFFLLISLRKRYSVIDRNTNCVSWTHCENPSEGCSKRAHMACCMGVIHNTTYMPSFHSWVCMSVMRKAQIFVSGFFFPSSLSRRPVRSEQGYLTCSSSTPKKK